MVLALAAFLLCLTSMASGIMNTTETYMHKALFQSGHIILYWRYTDNNITFEVHAKTKGWVGIGFSPNGGMAGADIIVGWVENEEVKVVDAHSTHNFAPIRDPQQDIIVYTGMECDGWTMFKFSRQLAACEDEYDRAITPNTMRFIWAFSDRDPAGGNLTAEDYHMKNRGTRSMLFLEPPEEKSSQIASGQINHTFDVKVTNFTIPAVQTYYNCKIMKVPELEQKNHIVKIAPLIQAGNERHVHHILIFHCGSFLEDPSELNVDRECGFTVHYKTCSTIIVAWAIGAGEMNYPPDAGFSLGAAGDPLYVSIETHYDNPGLKEGVIDNSGIRFTYTTAVRTHDVGILQVGNIVSGRVHFIPPGAESYISVGYCAGNCLAKRMAVGGVKNVTIFEAALHSHLAGRALKLRHIRNGTELPYIAYDDTYDFDYQDYRRLHQRIELQPDDELRMECTYNTVGRTEMTEGGLGTMDEMCLGFIFYYPKIDISACLSSAIPTQSWSYFGIQNASQIGDGRSLDDYIVEQPVEWKGKTVKQVMSGYNWTQQNIENFSIAYSKMVQQEFCVPQNRREMTLDYYSVKPVAEKYTAPVLTCVDQPPPLIRSVETAQCPTDGMDSNSSAASVTTGALPTRAASPPTTTSGARYSELNAAYFCTMLILHIAYLLV